VSSVRPSVYTIPPHRSFADALVAGLIAREGRDPMTLARGLILLPNNRAIRAIQDAFVRRSEGGLLLPRLVAIGDPELDERLGALLDPLDESPIPPAVEPLQRQLILARLVEQVGGAQGPEARRLAGLSGFQPGDLIILAARPSMGKTSLALNMAVNAAVKHKKTVGVFSLEMSKEQLVDRLFASMLGVDSWKLQRGKLDDSDFQNMGPIMDELHKANIFIDDSSGSSMPEFRTKATPLP